MTYMAWVVFFPVFIVFPHAPFVLSEWIERKWPA